MFYVYSSILLFLLYFSQVVYIFIIKYHNIYYCSNIPMYTSVNLLFLLFLLLFDQKPQKTTDSIKTANTGLMLCFMAQFYMKSLYHSPSSP